MNRGTLLGFGVSVLACIWLVATIDLARVAGSFREANPVWLLPALAVLAVQAVVRAWRWSGLAGAAAGGQPIPVRRTIEPMLAGYVVNAVLPGRLGEVARAVLLARREGIAIARSAASVVVERLVDLLGLLVLVSLALASLGQGIAVALAGGAAALAGVLLLGRHVTGLARLLPARTPARLGSAIRDGLAAVARVPRPALLRAAVLSAVAWLADAAMVWFAGRGLGIDVSLAAALTIGLGAALGTAIPAAPGYLATYEVAAVTFGGFAGLPAEVVLPIALTVHLVGVVTLALAGAVALGRVSGSLARVRESGRGSLLALSGDEG